MAMTRQESELFTDMVAALTELVAAASPDDAKLATSRAILQRVREYCMGQISPAPLSLDDAIVVMRRAIDAAERAGKATVEDISKAVSRASKLVEDQMEAACEADARSRAEGRKVLMHEEDGSARYVPVGESMGPVKNEAAATSRPGSEWGFGAQPPVPNSWPHAVTMPASYVKAYGPNTAKAKAEASRRIHQFIDAAGKPDGVRGKEGGCSGNAGVPGEAAKQVRALTPEEALSKWFVADFPEPPSSSFFYEEVRKAYEEAVPAGRIVSPGTMRSRLTTGENLDVADCSVSASVQLLGPEAGGGEPIGGFASWPRRLLWALTDAVRTRCRLQDADGRFVTWPITSAEVLCDNRLRVDVKIFSFKLKEEVKS